MVTIASGLERVSSPVKSWGELLDAARIQQAAKKADAKSAECATEFENSEGRGVRKLAANAEKFGARVEKPDAKWAELQGAAPVSQDSTPDWTWAGALCLGGWQDYEREMAEIRGESAAPAIPSMAGLAIGAPVGAGVEAGEPE